MWGITHVNVICCNMFMCEKNLFKTRQAYIFETKQSLTETRQSAVSWAILDRYVSPGNFCQDACCEHDFNVIAHIERSHFENN